MLRHSFAKRILHSFFLVAICSITVSAQYTSLNSVQGLGAGTYTFNFGNGNFQGYVDADGWLLWLQYHHQGGTNPALSVKNPGTNLPTYDSSPLGTNLSNNPSKWGHGSQSFAASIPDSNLWLRWEGVTSHHNRKIHFESPVIGRYLSNNEPLCVPEITYQNIHRPDHTANLPESATGATQSNGGNLMLANGPFWAFNAHSWEINSGGRWNVDDVRNANGSLIQFEHSTIHRVWVRPVQFDSTVMITTLEELQDHINGVATLTPAELTQVMNYFNIYAENLASSFNMMSLALEVIDDYDLQIGPLFTTPSTINGFNKNPNIAPGYELEKAMIALQQGVIDYVISQATFDNHPSIIDGTKFNSCVSFPGDIAPPSDPNKTTIIPIKASFQDPWGINPSFDMNGDGTEHAFRPTGQYLAPGSVVTVTVPDSLVGKDYYIRVGVHEWDLSNKPIYKRLNRISKKYLIDSTTMEVFNPLGGAIGILVPYGANEGIVDITIKNAVDAPFYSIKSFYNTPNFNTELNKPAPWAVFETERIMYTIPRHSIVPGDFDLQQTLMQWDSAMAGMSDILAREQNSDKHDLYMIADVLIRGGAYSIGYPQSNNQINYLNVPGPVNFIDGPGPKYEVNFHEHGHSVRISKFPGEPEAAVNFPYIMALNNGLGQDLNTAVEGSFVPHTFDIDNTATHRLLSNTFGTNRDISNTVTDEVRYQHRGYGHYFEIVNILGWCPMKNFWLQEYIDFENGIDHGINNQDIDSRIIRMSVAAGADLRPLFHVFGILPQNPSAVQNQLNQLNILPSISVYNRLQQYMNLIPSNNAAYVSYALEIYPDLFTNGPNANPNYGIGWFYQKSLTYDGAEATSRENTLQNIINQYFPSGAPTTDINASLCCKIPEICDGVDNDGDGMVDEHEINEWIGPDGCYWHESSSYWSLCQIPNSCNKVIIGEDKHVVVESAKIANAFSIELSDNAMLELESGSQVNVIIE